MSEYQVENQTSLAVGATLGKYRLEQILEQRIPLLSFLARDQQTQQYYRLWILALPNLTPEDRVIYLGHFQQEAGRLLALQHPNLLSLSDYGISQGTPYLVAPYFPAQSLSALLDEKGPMDYLQASRYLDLLAGALEYAHQQGLWHLNLTTDCLLLQDKGKLVVTELGFMRILGAGANLALAHPQTSKPEAIPLVRDVNGKPLYGLSDASAPPPELLLGSSVDGSADVYGIGAVFYRMLTGHRVFYSNTPEELARQHLNAPIPSLSRWRADTNAGIDSLLMLALAKDPARRFQRPEAFANACRLSIVSEDTGHQAVVTTSSPQIAVSEEQSPIGATASPPLRPAPKRRRSSYTPASAKTHEPSFFTRRRLVTLLVASAGAVATVTIVTLFAKGSPVGNASSSTPVVNGGSSSSSPTASSAHGTVLAKASDVSVNSAKTFPLAGNNNPGLLIHLPDNRFVAFDSTCTHAGCSVAYNASNQLLECPCHGAVFDPAKNAAVVQGPAPSPLKAIPITKQADGTITTGSH